MVEYLAMWPNNVLEQTYKLAKIISHLVLIKIIWFKTIILITEYSFIYKHATKLIEIIALYNVEFYKFTSFYNELIIFDKVIIFIYFVAYFFMTLYQVMGILVFNKYWMRYNLQVFKLSFLNVTQSYGRVKSV